MNYRQAAEWLDNLTDPERSGLDRSFGRRMGLDTTVALMAGLDNPHLQVPAVHIAGTKGKGSVAAIIESVARADGLRTGLFTSPHLVTWRERVQHNGEAIPESDVARLATRVRPVAEQIVGPRGRGATFFEVYFALAMLAFAEWDVDLAVVEVGLGGRLDATNVITPLLSAITTLGLEHTRILGDTITQIAAEKAGIIKRGIPVVSAPQPSEAMTVVEAVARERGCDLTVAAPLERIGVVVPARPRDFAPGQRPDITQPVRANFRDETVEARLSLPGDHQLVNAGVASAACAALGMSSGALAEGLAHARWPARVEVVEARPWLVLDCAHTRDSARALMATLRRHLQYRRLAMMLGLSRDKDAEGIADELRDADRVIVTAADMPRAMSTDELAERIAGRWRNVEVIPDAATALAAAREWADEDDCVCVTGSVFLIGELLADGSNASDEL